MNKNTVYVLQKDLPFAKAGVDFIRENEDADYYNTNFASYHDRLHKSRVENNPEWFKPKEQVNESKPTEQFQWTNELINEYVENCVKASQMNENYVSPETFIQSKSKTEQPLWEILSFKQDTGIIDLWTKFSHGWCRTNEYGQPVTKAYGYNEILKNPLYKIYSVKRLSDGEVFTVGDMVGWGVYKDFQTKLLKFIINDNGVLEFKYMNFANRYSCVDFINAHELYKVKEEAPKEEQVPIKAKEIINTFESFSKGYSMGYHDAKKYTDKKYTEEQLLQARRDAFDAAREVVGYSDALKNSPVTVGRKYKDNEDYINSLNK